MKGKGKRKRKRKNGKERKKEKNWRSVQKGKQEENGQRKIFVRFGDCQLYPLSFSLMYVQFNLESASPLLPLIAKLLKQKITHFF